MSTYFWYGDPRVKLMAQSVTGGVMVGFLLGLAASAPDHSTPARSCPAAAQLFEERGMK